MKLLILLSAISYWSNAANILGIYFHAGKSHHILGEMLLKELARRGHNVTMASPFPLKEPFPNYTDIYLDGIIEDQISREEKFMKMNKGSPVNSVPDVLEWTRAQTELTLKHTKIADLKASGTKFDVLIMDWFMNGATLVFGDVFDAPIVLIASHGTTALANYIVGNPSPPSFVPNAMLNLPSNMTFPQRVLNTVVSIAYYVVGIQNLKYHQDLIKKYQGDYSGEYHDLRDNVAVVLSNGHYSYESPRPLVPNLIQVGGFHVQKPKPLPKDLKRFMDNAKEGVIYFSLGSNAKSVLLPEEKQREILRAFSKIPFKVIWKWEADHLTDKPSNVMIGKWFPQNDILAHPNLKLFISHGGLLSTIEAIYHGVPVIGIPIFGDQKTNIPIAVKNGYAIQLDLNDLTAKTLSDAILEILSNPIYKINALKRSSLLRDQPLPPMDAAVFWVEHAIRHKGAKHLENTGVYLSWFAYMGYDVLVFLLSIVIFLIWLTYWTLRKILSKVFCKTNESKSKKQKDKKNR